MRRLNVQFSQIDECIRLSLFAVGGLPRNPPLQRGEVLLLQLTKADADRLDRTRRRIEFALVYDHYTEDPTGAVSREHWPNADRTWPYILHCSETVPTIPFSLEDLAGDRADVDLLRSFGICLDESGSPEALAVFQRVLAMEPRDAIALSRVRRLKARQGMVAAPPRPASRSRSPRKSRPRRQRVLPSHEDARRQFSRVFPGLFADPKYLSDERDYKWAAHCLWREILSQDQFRGLLNEGSTAEICRRLRQVNGRVNLLTRYESAALGDVAKTREGADLLANGIFGLVYEAKDAGPAIDALALGLQRLNARGTSPCKWPIVTLFPFLAHPSQHLFVKPEVTKRCAERLGFTLNYHTVPNAMTYACVLELATRLKEDLSAWQPRDNIDVQSFIWVTSSSGYQIADSDG